MAIGWGQVFDLNLTQPFERLTVNAVTQVRTHTPQLATYIRPETCAQGGCALGNHISVRRIRCEYRNCLDDGTDAKRMNSFHTGFNTNCLHEM